MNRTTIILSLAAIAFFSSRGNAMALPGSAHINAVDLDIVPSQRDKFLEAIAEDAAADHQGARLPSVRCRYAGERPKLPFPVRGLRKRGRIPVAPGNGSLQVICSNDREHGRKARNPAHDGDLFRAEASLSMVRLPPLLNCRRRRSRRTRHANQETCSTRSCERRVAARSLPQLWRGRHYSSRPRGSGQGSGSLSQGTCNSGAPRPPAIPTTWSGRRISW